MFGAKKDKNVRYIPFPPSVSPSLPVHYPSIVIEFARHVNPLCRRRKFGGKIYYISRDIELFLGDYFGAPRRRYRYVIMLSWHDEAVTGGEATCVAVVIECCSGDCDQICKRSALPCDRRREHKLVTAAQTGCIAV